MFTRLLLTCFQVFPASSERYTPPFLSFASMTAKTRSELARETDIPALPKSLGNPVFIFFQVSPPSIDLYNPEFLPPDSIIQGKRRCCHIAAYRILGLFMSIDREEAPVMVSTNNTFFHDFPPSVVL